jgi:hypothetical protein
MKHVPYLSIITSASAIASFICSYFFHLTMENAEQYLAVVGVMFLDGIFGIIAGTKREGFQTRKAISVLRNTFVWTLILTAILMIEKGFEGTSWLSEVVVVPFMIFQLISALKNASMAGYIKVDHLNHFLDQIDKHKGLREK